MSQEELQNKYDRLLDRVNRMRGFQREWQKTRALSPDEKKKMKHLEWEVDGIVKQEIAQQKSQQQNIF